MPRIRTGEHTTEQVDIIFNTLGVFNRLNIAQLYEQSITFICEQIVFRMKQLDINKDIKEFEHMLFRMLEIFNAEQSAKLKSYYVANCTTKTKKKEFFETVMEEGIHVHIEPFWHKENLYDAIKQCYNEFSWIKPYEVYFFDKTSKRWVKQINNQIIGKMYVMVLKQNSKKGLSVCATAPINKRGLPDKTDSAKRHKSIVQHTPVRSGIQETINNITSFSENLLAKLHMFYRSSSVARRILGTTLINNFGNDIPVEVDLTDKMTNANVEILGAFLKIMGLELIHEHDELYLPDNSEDDNELKVSKFNGNTYLMTPIEMRREVAKDLARRELESQQCITIGDDPMFVDQFVDELADLIEAEIDEDPSGYVSRRYSEDY